nr:hypothetical protein [Treponema sp.]
MLQNESNIGSYKDLRDAGEIGECTQGIIIDVNKIRGIEQVHIYIIINFDYKKINNLVMYLQNDYTYKGWKTGAFPNIGNFLPDKNCDFYICKDTDLKPIVSKIHSVIKEYGFPILEKFDTYQKFENSLYEQNEIKRFNLIHGLEWNLLGLSVMLKNHPTEEILEKFHDKLCDENGSLEGLKNRLSDQDKIREILK